MSLNAHQGLTSMPIARGPSKRSWECHVRMRFVGRLIQIEPSMVAMYTVIGTTIHKKEPTPFS